MSRACILVVEDDPSQREQLAGFLASLDLDVRTAGDLAAARAELTRGGVDAVVTDLMLPDGESIDLVSWAVARHPMVDLVVVTAHGTVERAVEAMRAGAHDFLTKPLNLDVLEQRIGRLLEKRRLAREVRELTRRLEDRVHVAGVVAESPAMQRLLSMARRMAPTDSTVLVTGESGTGKEVVAEILHGWSRRRDGPFVRVNCGALTETLLESELFGHVRGAFTGADRDRDGLFVAADGGTLLLDEIGEVSPALQVKLLRVLQDRTVVPVGATAGRRVDVRVIASTHRDLEHEVRAGRFRQDVLFRLNVLALHVPPLRERPEDTSALIPVLLRRYAEENGLPPPRISREAHDRLLSHPFPGNVRELQNLLQRAVILSTTDRIEASDLPEPSQMPGTGTEALPLPDARRSLPELVEQIERKALRRALAEHGGVRVRAAKSLGIPERVLRYKLKRYGIE